MKRHWGLALAGILAFIGMGQLEAQGEVSAPISVPLHFTDIGGGIYKLGIYVGIGTDAAPALFEFDTGGAGFYAAYSDLPGVSPWWGSGVNPQPSQPVTNLYDSGLKYTGVLANAAVSLYSSAAPSSVLMTTPGNVGIGQMNTIEKVNVTTGTVEQTLWTNAGNSTANPPIDTKFYGDFGLSSTYAANGIANLLNQMVYTNGVVAGYRIHVDATNREAWLQIGLTAADTASPTAMYFGMNIDTAANGAVTPNANLNYYSEQIFNANITIRDPATGEILNSADVGMTPDTGATTSIHNTQSSPVPLPDEYDQLIEWSNEDNTQGELKKHLEFGLSGTTLSGDDVSFFNFETTDIVNDGNVTIQNNHPNNTTYYLNTGITLFEKYDIIYNTQEGIIGLDAVPEPSTIGLALLALGSIAVMTGVRRRARF